MPHNGCPHQCSFCNQKNIVGQATQPSPDFVKNTIESALIYLKEDSINAEIAFFGGSFTAIDREYMISLLDATTEYIDMFKGIRISTRPDCIDEEVLNILKQYKVTSIELGAQSMDDKVLLANGRGHNSLDVVKSSKLIKSYGFSLGLQMMTGLYESDDCIDYNTALMFVDLHPDTVRIYPTIVIKNTDLERLYNDKCYLPQTLDGAVSACSKLLSLFSMHNIPVIRLGLHHSDSLVETIVAGPYHPSFRELCESKLIFDKLLNLFKKENRLGEFEVLISPGCVSKLIGNKRSNLIKLNELGYNIKIIQSNTINNMDVVLKK